MKNPLQKYYIITLSALGILLLVILVSTRFPGNEHKVGYVRSGHLIENFKGMQEAREIFRERQILLSIKLDSLQAIYQRSESDFIENINQYSQKEREDKRIRMEEARHAYNLKVQEMDEMLNNKDAQMTQGVLNQVNSFVEEFGKKNGYDLILGTTSSGSILYGNQYLDITEEVLKELNAQYKIRN